MALSNLKEYTKENYEKLAITEFQKNPGVAKQGHPDDEADINPAGWIGNDTMAFTVTNDAKSKSSVSIDAAATDVLNVDVENGTSPISTITYWTVETGGGNGKFSEWSVSYEVKREGRKTGKWVFTKGKDDDGGKK